MRSQTRRSEAFLNSHFFKVWISAVIFPISTANKFEIWNPKGTHAQTWSWLRLDGPRFENMFKCFRKQLIMNCFQKTKLASGSSKMLTFVLISSSILSFFSLAKPVQMAKPWRDSTFWTFWTFKQVGLLLTCAHGFDTRSIWSVHLEWWPPRCMGPEIFKKKIKLVTLLFNGYPQTRASHAWEVGERGVGVGMERERERGIWCSAGAERKLALLDWDWRRLEAVFASKFENFVRAWPKSQSWFIGHMIVGS